MTNREFIDKIATYVIKHAPRYNICVHSPIIAQACLESAYGTSELAVNANNYFGLKWREGRCPTACGIYHKVGSEQNADGTYTSSAMKWMKFLDMESGVIGYFDFTNISNYSNLKGVTDPKKYLENIKADGYATSLDYVNKVYSVIEKFNLTKYDNVVVDKIIALDAGHGLNTAGKRCMKALDPDQTREWQLNDRIMDMVESRLANYNCKVVRVDDTTGAKDISLSDRAKAANNAKADLYVSMHHNAGLNGRSGGGTIVFYYSSNPNRPKEAQRLYDHIVSRTGLVGNRSKKVDKNAFAVLKKTSMAAFLVENGFMDSPTDVPTILSQDHAIKTVEGVVAFLVEELSLKAKTSSEIDSTRSGTYFPQYKGSKTTLSIALQSLGIDYSYAYRKTIAVANGISGYKGTASQNTHMYNLLVAGLLKKP